jgi:predicted nuclease of predicted toxin-antitoxin system
MKLYLDEHIQPLLSHVLTSRGIDCLTTQAAGNLGRSDEEQLAFATSQKRVIITFDRKDFLSLAQQWAADNRPHAGIVLAKPCSLSELLVCCCVLSLSIRTRTSPIKPYGFRTTRCQEVSKEVRSPLLSFVVSMRQKHGSRASHIDR